MSLRKTRQYVRFAGTAIAALLLVTTSTSLSGSPMGWVLLPFWVPGSMLAAGVQTTGIFGDQFEAQWILAFLINFAICWVLLYDLPKLIAKRIARNREHA
jgi:hypothetical protein